MIGKMLRKIRRDKEITQVVLSKKTGINLGHITHIEQEDRHPSFSAFKSICNVIGTPYFPLMSIYDKDITPNQEKYNIYNHLNYNKIISIDSAYSLIDCPENMNTASFAITVPDNSMEPKLPYKSKAFIEFGAPLENRDIGLFLYENELLLRRFIIKKNINVLRPLNEEYTEILVSDDDEFQIIGKVVGVV